MCQKGQQVALAQAFLTLGLVQYSVCNDTQLVQQVRHIHQQSRRNALTREQRQNKYHFDPET